MSSDPFLNLLSFITQDDRYCNEMIFAKDEFERYAGQIFETDPSYDARINAFHNWYILDRPLTRKRVTPLQYFIEYNANSFSQNVLEGLRELKGNIHSVFELTKFGKTGAAVRDLASGIKYVMEREEAFESLDKGSVFNTRLFNHGKSWTLSNYLILHPYSVTKLIKDEAGKLRKSGRDSKAFLFRLLFFQSRWEQYRQMEVKQIYRFQSESPRPP